MLIDLYDMKEYIRHELDDISDSGTIHELFCTVLEHNGISYIAFRRARLLDMCRQLSIFKRYG